jgi:regulator of sigma E protease
MIAKMAGEQASAGGSSFLAFMALLSVNLGVLNLLPVPVLDGGHLFFFCWELVFRRPVSQKAREYAQQVGLMLLLGLMLLAFYNDIIRYFVNRQG